MNGIQDKRERGQSVVEFTLIIPVFVLFLLGMLEFGFAFNHNMTLEYASREASRTGSSLGNGGSTNCIAGIDINMIDAQAVAAAQRILKSPGSPVVMSDVSEIRLYHADVAGNQIGGQANTWRYTPGAGPDIDPGLGIDKLDFSPVATGWPVCSRTDGPVADSIGVRISYTYRFSTPLGSLMTYMGASGFSQISIVDQTVMALNPSV